MENNEIHKTYTYYTVFLRDIVAHERKTISSLAHAQMITLRFLKEQQQQQQK